MHTYRWILEKGQDMCVCSDFRLTRYQGHVRIRLDEVEGVDRYLHSSRNITCGRTISKFQLMEKIYQAIPRACRSNMLQIKNEDIERCFRTQEVKQNGAMTEQEVTQQVGHLQHLVLVPLDRNPGATLVICPTLYMHTFRLTFCWNAAFRSLIQSESEFLVESKGAYDDAGLQNVAIWRTSGKLGRAYIIPKDKDYSRWRHISPSWSEPSRTASTRLRRALRYMLLCLPVSYHFSLRSTDHLNTALSRGVASLKKVGGMIVARSYDIKDMFVKLPHEEIIASVDWLVKIHEKKNLVAVKTSVRGKNCKMARTLHKEEGYICLSFLTVMAMLRYELGHVYTICNGRAYQQVFGIPMGNHSSLALADLMCTKAEYMFLMSLGSERCLVSGVRLANDVSVMVAAGNNGTDSQRVSRVFHRFADAYPPTLKLVRKDDCGYAWDFLGCKVFLVPDVTEVHVFPRTKNQAWLTEQGTLHYHSMQDYRSYSAKKVKRMTMTAFMLRLWRSSTDEQAAGVSIVCLIRESRLRGHPPEVFFGSLARLAKVVGGPWRSWISQVYPHHGSTSVR
ncbi:hypothetical protein CBR_g19678 [Chara braunii]|uniref:Reverse transcriptase domain-containing protein n=1 Tax=Chara braunii TaxID=69332 RepID=A0A388KYN8_CHABU|nr:hypothetical protein CBR_g19678 [Chara braunii]|eukprot:GBG75165.1 hypothetical protein CBR_g19678 [Chara braunii]